MSVQWPEHFASRVVGTANGNSGVSSVCIALEAWRRGLEVTFQSHNLQKYSISDEQRRVEFDYSRPQSITRQEDHEKLDRKGETLHLLRKHDVPTPRGIRFAAKDMSHETLQHEADQIGYPLVLKPDQGSFGRGVMTGLQNWDDLKAAYDHLLQDLRPETVLLEKHHSGDDYRLLVVGDQVVGAVRRVPANVIGDGQATIRELIDRRNTARKQNPFLAGGLVKVDFEVQKCLADQDLNLADVPAQGHTVQLRRVANASAGGDVVDATDEIPEQMKLAAVRAVQAIPRIVIAGVDILFDDTTNEYVVIEMNSRPHIGVNMYPSVGIGRDAPRAIIDTLFPGTRRSESDLVKTLRFSSGAVGSAIRTGATTQVTLPPLPDHAYPHRVRSRFAIESEDVASKRLPAGELQLIAHRHGVVGSVRRTGARSVEADIAARDEATADRVLRKLTTWAGSGPTSQTPWDGAVSTTFLVTE